MSNKVKIMILKKVVNQEGRKSFDTFSCKIIDENGETKWVSLKFRESLKEKMIKMSVGTGTIVCLDTDVNTPKSYKPIITKEEGSNKETKKYPSVWIRDFIEFIPFIPKVSQSQFATPEQDPTIVATQEQFATSEEDVSVETQEQEQEQENAIF